MEEWMRWLSVRIGSMRRRRKTCDPDCVMSGDRDDHCGLRMKIRKDGGHRWIGWTSIGFRLHGTDVLVIRFDWMDSWTADVWPRLRNVW